MVDNQENRGKWGNYELYKHGFKTDKEEAYTAQISIRLAPSLKEKLVKIDGWKDKSRAFFAELVKQEELKQLEEESDRSSQQK